MVSLPDGKTLACMLSDLPAHALTHLKLALTALALATSVGLPLGTLAAQFAPSRGVVLALASIGRTLPSIAVLMLLLPFLGVGTEPAVAALALLAIPPIVIATDLGIRGVPAAALDAAAGMGMTGFQRFVRVVVPLASPIGFTGIRTAATETIASATLATFVGAGGLGDDIVRGLQTNEPATLFAGAGAVALLALLAEFAGGRIGTLLEARA